MDEPADLTGIESGDTTGSMTMRRPQLIRWLILCGVALIAAIAVGTALMVDHFRERALANSERELNNTSLLLARHLDQELEELAIVQKSLIEQMHSAGITSREDYERQMSAQDVHLMLRSKINALSHVRGLSLIDSDGKLINFTRAWPAPKVNVADRAYFKSLQSDPQLTTVLSEPVQNRSDSAWTIVIARKITAPNGEFLGVVVGGIDLAYFEQFFASVALGQDAAIAMFHRDGTLLARHPKIESMIGRNFITGPLFQRFLVKTDHGTTRLESLIDGQDRLVSGRRLNHFPIAIVASTTASAALADWWEQTRFLIGVASLSILVIAVILFLIVRQLSREHNWSRQSLTLEKLRLDTAVNNMTQGLLLFDSSKRIVVCNSRYIEMYGLSPDVVKPGCTLHELICHRKEVGSFFGDVDQYCSDIDRALAEGRATSLEVETTGNRSIRIVNQPLANGGWVATHEDITERKRAEERIARLANYDVLTDLPNRALFHTQLEQALKWTRRGGRLAVLYLDLDHFKSVNDTLGHPIGDELLKAVAERLRGCVRDTDVIARLGGDEFAIVQTAAEQPKGSTVLVKRVHEAIRQPFEFGGHQLVADTSIGIAIAPDDGTDPDQLMKNADLALYGAKADGRGTYRYFEPDMDARVKARRALEFDLRQAIMCDEFELHYQPVVNLRDNKIGGCEALLRWRHPRRGVIAPSEFIPVAEETGLIAQLGDWVLRTACAEAATWPGEINIAVNISPAQFRSQNLVEMVISALAASNLSAHRLEFEITESVLMRNNEGTLRTLHQLRELGVRIVMDDFGTGYSSLSYLRSFPFDRLKIDRSFIGDLSSSSDSLKIVQAITRMASGLSMTTTAEGVETEQQLANVHAAGCTEMQGYLFSPPLPAKEILQLLLSSVEKAEKAA